MAQTLLDYLTKPNTRLLIHISSLPTYTQHPEWAPVEEIRNWEEFNFTSLAGRYHTSLSAKTDLFSTVTAAEEAGHNVVCDEAGLSILLGSTNVSMVSRALPNPLFIAPGSRFIATPRVRPDWGAGNVNLQYTYPSNICQALVCGDTKLEWDVERAIRLVAEGDYEEKPDAHIVRPFEQIQHYCTVYRTRYGFILTNECIVIIRLRLSPPMSKQRPSRPPRQKVSEGHHRVLSNTSTTTNISEISDSFSAMSFQPMSQDEDVASLEVLRIPWDHGSSEETVNLALYLLVRLANEGRELSHQYEPLYVEHQMKLEKRKRPGDSPENLSGSGSRKPKTS